MSDEVEALAEVLSWVDGEMTRHSDTAHPDHHRWSWRGDGHPEAMREAYREKARAVISWMGAQDALERRERAARGQVALGSTGDVQGAQLVVTRAQRRAASAMAERDKALGRPTRAAVKKIAEARPACD